MRLKFWEDRIKTLGDMNYDWEKWDLLPSIPQNLLVGSVIKHIALLSDAYPIFWLSLKSIRQTHCEK